MLLLLLMNTSTQVPPFASLSAPPTAVLVLVSATFRFVHSYHLFRHYSFLATTHDYNDFSYMHSVYLGYSFLRPGTTRG